MNDQKQSALPCSHGQRWLLAHDIKDKKRLQRVWRYLSQEGVRLQYSVYVVAGSRAHLEGVLERLRELVDAKVDDVRVYPLTSNTRIWGLGSQFVEGENTLIDEFVDTLIVRDPTISRAPQA